MNLFREQHRFDWKQCSSRLLLCLSGFLFLSNTPSWASEASKQEIAEASIEGLQADGADAENRVDSANSLRSTPIVLSEFEQPATTIDDWVTQIAQSRVTITDVRVEEMEAGVQVVLETAGGELSAPSTQTVGDALIAEIPNAMLDLSERETFEQFGPAEGISLVSVTELPDGSVRVSITGTDAPPQAEVSAEAGSLVLSVVPGIAQVGDADEGIQVIVTGEQTDSDYFVPNASNTLRTDIPLRNTPSSIQVVPQEVIRDQGATSVREIVRNVSGINFSSAGRNRGEQFVIRGFNNATSNFRNGLRDDFFTTRTATDLANIDRVEVLKGPASILFGRIEPGGVINLVTEQPLREPFYEIDFTAGSFDFYRPTLDFTGPLTESGNLAYRLNAAYQSAGSFRDGVETERFLVAPTLSWQISDNTNLTLEYSYLNDTRPLDRGLVVLSNNEVADIPLSTFLGDPSIREDFDEHRAELYFDHQFNDNLSLHSLLRYANSIEGGPGFTSQIVGNSADDRNFPVEEGRGRQTFESFTFQNDLVTEFNTGSLKHTVLFGLEYFTGSNTFRRETRSSGIIDIFNASAFTPATNEPFEFIFSGGTHIDSFGIYLQNQIAILDNFQFLIGGRFDTYNEEFEFNEEITKTEADAFSPRIGIVYQPIEPVSLYASYTRSFTPTFGTNTNGEAFDPQRGTAFEVGVKAEIIQDRLSSTLAFYDTTLTNITTDDPANPGLSIQTGEQNSRGIELDIAGEILPGWDVFAGYAYTDATITEDNNFTVGNRLNNVPEHNFNLWTIYTLQEGDLAGLGFGAGVFFVGERTGDLDNSFSVDDYTRVDAAIYYERENFRAALNFKNLFDAEFFEGTRNRLSVQPGAPFTVQGTVSVNF